jgi:hypothetical protein
MKTREASAEVTIGGTKYRWSIDRYPRYTSEGYFGLRIHVQAEHGARLLVVDFPFEERDHRTMPHHQRPRPSARELSSHIVSAINAGWEPASRGRPFVFAVSKDSPLIATGELPDRPLQRTHATRVRPKVAVCW